MSRQLDVVIIGGGFAGIHALYRKNTPGRPSRQARVRVAVCAARPRGDC